MPKSIVHGRAFTLIELLVTIAIIAILVVAGLSTARGMLEKSKAVSCLGNMRQLGAIALTYSAEHDNNILPVVQYKTVVGGAGSTWITILVDEGYLPKEEWTNLPRSIMRCPSRNNNPQYFGPKLHYGLNFYPGFTNTAMDTPTAHTSFAKLSKIQRPAKTFMFGEVQNNYWLNTDGSRAANIYPHSGGQNLVFFDGHVEYFKGLLTLDPTATDPYPFY